MRAFSGTRVLSLQSVEDIAHFPFPSRAEPGLAHHPTGKRDDFMGLAARDTACWDLVYFIYIFFL